MKPMYRLGIDIGGTFTDAVLLNEETGEARTVKVPSTPDDLSRGFLNAVHRILADRWRIPHGRRIPGPRHDRRHQLDHRGKDRPHRVCHHRRLPRHARDRAADQTKPI